MGFFVLIIRSHFRVEIRYRIRVFFFFKTYFIEKNIYYYIYVLAIFYL